MKQDKMTEARPKQLAWQLPPGAVEQPARGEEGDATSTASEEGATGTTAPKHINITTPDEIWSEIESNQIFQPCPYSRTVLREKDHGGNTQGDGSSIFTKPKRGTTVSVAMVSDTHSRHGMFGGYEVPIAMHLLGTKLDANGEPDEAGGTFLDAKEYLDRASKQQPNNKVLRDIWKVAVERQKNDNSGAPAGHAEFLSKSLPLRKGLVHQSDTMAILPVMLLSGNHKSVVPPSEWIGDDDDASTSFAATKEVDSGVTPPLSESRNTEFEFPIIPYADILIHCGDLTMKGSEGEMESFVQFMAQLPHPHKIVVAGNHDVCLDQEYVSRPKEKQRWRHLKSAPPDLPARLKQRMKDAGIIYLEDEKVTVDVDVTPLRHHCLAHDSATTTEVTTTKKQVSIFGSPSQPKFHDWAFQLQEGQASKDYWQTILPSASVEEEEQLDILITHTPPLGRADRVFFQKEKFYAMAARRAETRNNNHNHTVDVDIDKATIFSALPPYQRKGCPHLLWQVQHCVKPKLHCFGHIHEDAVLTEDSFDGTTTYINACVAGHHHDLRRDSYIKAVCLPM
jgi:predicted phosphohydrolase